MECKLWSEAKRLAVLKMPLLGSLCYIVLLRLSDTPPPNKKRDVCTFKPDTKLRINQAVLTL